MYIQMDYLLHKMLVAIWPFYTRFALIGGSIVLWLYIVQWGSGLLISMNYPLVFDTGMSGVELVWWETYWGSFLIRIHSEFGNLLFLMIYIHILIKIWVQACFGEIDQTWLSGVVIFICTLLAGITGAIMPCSILSEVTITVIGSAVSSLSFVQFDFLESIFLPGAGLSDESLFRVFVVHLAAPSLALVITADHLNHLHSTEYTDEDEMDLIAVNRHEYWNEFIWLEIGYWFEVLMFFLASRLWLSVTIPVTNTVSYTFSNFEYWPAIEEIDYVLAVPHWYLRPLMSSLVVIPHHYLGFFYIIICFCSLFFLPWANDNNGITMTNATSDYVANVLPHDININMNYMYFTLFSGFAFITAIVPTGRYFISLGSSEMLVLVFWFLIFYFFFMYRIGLYFTNISLKY